MLTETTPTATTDTQTMPPKNKGGRPRNTVPTLLKHQDGRAYVVVDGRHLTLGQYGTPEAVERYNRFVQELKATGKPGYIVRERIGTTTVQDLGAKYLAHAKTYYVKRGEPTQHAANIARVLALLYRAGLGTIPVDAFGPKSLKRFIDFLAGNRDASYKRKTINHYAGLIVGMFRWGVSEELVEGETWTKLRAVGRVGKGRAVGEGQHRRVPAESRKVMPVDPEVLKATLRHLSRVVRGMVQVQLICAMRPEEVCYMRAGDLVQTPEGMEYRVRDDANKLAHHAIARIIPIGKQAEAIIRTFTEGLRPDDYVFSPAVAESERLEKRRADAIAAGRRVQPEEKLVTGKSRRATVRNMRARRAPRYAGDHYITEVYRQNILRACGDAGVEKWSPNRLRHTGASAIANAGNIHIAREVLGHGDIRTTQGYVHANRVEAFGIVNKIKIAH